ncbi:hypothetical protein ASN18_2893 [Candidatus Magnetominusculus xianensis]|uniref:Uncharacterized protein n=1 Tax=Candidatus Magnetominusculus xianensis TaxID=1748249 RepID=A0ABR5SD21_9BACT|nr:hypothetical protein ASN18_2893 [Candidatus Magnetominusculus xianensis]
MFLAAEEEALDNKSVKKSSLRKGELNDEKLTWKLRLYSEAEKVPAGLDIKVVMREHNEI